MEQELNEITNGTISQNNLWRNANSPIPRSYSANPGLFWGIHGSHLLSADACVRVARADWVAITSRNFPARRLERARNLTKHRRHGSVAQDFGLLGAFASLQYDLNPCWTAEVGVGYAERAPVLTQLYAAEHSCTA